MSTGLFGVAQISGVTLSGGLLFLPALFFVVSGGGDVFVGPVFLDQGFQFGKGGGLGGVVHEVVVLFRVGLIVVKLGALIAVVPFGVAVPRGAAAVAGELAPPY